MMSDSNDKKIDRVRREYDRYQLDEKKLPGDPLQLFAAWMEDATRSGNPDPTAMTLSTVDDSGSPSSRIVLLKKIDQNKLIFFTNYKSRKAKEIGDNSKVAAHFYWPELERQVKISGDAKKVKDSDSDIYFSSRPLESQISTWASPQSEIIPDRDYLEQKYREYLAKFKGSANVPRPSSWGGFALDPKRMEFWQGGKYRLHDRIEYTLQNAKWSRVRLAP
jgi:pyridoxamine 5'-phosphate oxidase